jgi:hypothetical protein
MKFPTAELRRGSPDVCPRPGAARKIEDYYVFPMGHGFAQSVNHARNVAQIVCSGICREYRSYRETAKLRRGVQLFRAIGSSADKRQIITILQ